MHKVGPALTSVEDHSRPNWAVLVMSGLPPVATVERTSRFGSFVPPGFRARWSRRMSQMGQNAKYSLRADVFRFAPDNRHAVTAPP